MAARICTNADGMTMNYTVRAVLTSWRRWQRCLKWPSAASEQVVSATPDVTTARVTVMMLIALFVALRPDSFKHYSFSPQNAITSECYKVILHISINKISCVFA